MPGSKNDLKKSDIKKIEETIEKIENVIDKQGEYIFFIVDDVVKPVSKGSDKDETKQDFLSKLSGKTRYIDNDVYEVRIFVDRKYIKETSEYAAGPVSLKIKQYAVNKKFKLEHHVAHRSGAVWYTNQDILNNEFQFGKIKDIIDAIHHKKIDILNISGVRAVNVLNYKKK